MGNTKNADHLIVYHIEFEPSEVILNLTEHYNVEEDLSALEEIWNTGEAPDKLLVISWLSKILGVDLEYIKQLGRETIETLTAERTHAKGEIFMSGGLTYIAMDDSNKLEHGYETYIKRFGQHPTH